MATVTEIALRTIRQDDYMTAAESLEFLKGPSHRSSISRQLESTLRALGFEGDKEEMVRYLFLRMLETDPALSRNRKSFLQTVKRWFYENVTPSRDMAFKCCFALGLNIEQAGDLLRKGCFLNGFNLRDAEEVIYFFCLLNALPYSAAQEMLSSFDAAPERDEARGDIGTRALEALLEGAKWDSRESFLHDFLIPNKSSFIGYSKTAAAVFESECGKLCYNVIRQHLNMLHQTDLVSDDESASRESYWQRDPVLSQLLRYLDARAEKDADWAAISALLHSRRSADARETAGTVERFVVEKQRELKRDWNRILTADRMFDEAVYGIPEYWHESRKLNRGRAEFTAYREREGLKHSSLHESSQVLSSFPRASDFTKIKFLRGRQAFAPETRKALVLLKFFNYCYAYMRSNASLGYEIFYEELTDLLETCHLAYLYPGDPFDWLVLKSAYLFELSSDDYDYEEDGNPIEYFNEVIRLSFDKPEA